MNINICDISNNSIIVSPVNINECAICLDTTLDGLYHYSNFSNNCECNYYIHTKCLHNWMRTSKESLCIFCKKPMYYLMDVSMNQQYIPSTNYVIQNNQPTIAEMDYQVYPLYYYNLSSYITNDPDIRNYVTSPYIVDNTIVLERNEFRRYPCNIIKSVRCVIICTLIILFVSFIIYSNMSN